MTGIDDDMDMSAFSGKLFIKLEDVAAKSLRETIVNVRNGDYGPELEFKSGDRLSLNATNTRTLIRAYGKFSRGWIGMEIELYAGETAYQGQKVGSVLVRPLSPPRSSDPSGPPGANGQGAGMNDDIPF